MQYDQLTVKENSRFDTNVSGETAKILRLPACEQEKQMSRNIGCTPRLNGFVSERDVSPGVSKLLCTKTIDTYKQKPCLGLILSLFPVSVLRAWLTAVLCQNRLDYYLDYTSC